MYFKLAVFSTALNILALIMPLALLQVYDRILPNQNSGSAFVIFSAVAIALLLGGVLRAARARMFSHISATADHRNWMLVSDRLMSQNVEFETAQHLMDGPAKARDFEAGEAAVGLYDAPFVLVFIGLIWFLGGQVVLVPLGIIFLAAGVVLFTHAQGSAARQLFERDNREMKRIVTQIANSTGGDLRSIAGQMAQMSTLLRRRAQALLGVEAASARQLDLMQVAGLATTVLIVGFGAAVVLNGHMTTGGLAACTLLGSRAASQGIGAVLAMTRRADTQTANRLMRSLEKADASEAPPTDCMQVLSRVFSEEEISTGDVILIKGDETKQEARVLQSLVTALWGTGAHRTDAVLVPARPEFVRGTLLENLSGFEKERAQDALALSIALGLDVMIGRLAQGYETNVSRTENGGLSHGAVKRAMIVQALVARPRLLLLERPAAGLDLDGRKRLASVLNEHAQDITVVMTTTEAALSEIVTKRICAPAIALQNEAGK
ncbi:hypothetical protein J7413_00015 [Shimia sp. R10_1]|uniref:hypothetical protein n=1 Tax=Shimia sp. R10_1 TaxID=2821095 RepID=UPI001AD96006|nr:hypothetical protein [Shimia sp. R10_1]MBO9471910.1 hypothetical protein [Shimia sp. R10_1]